MITDPYPGHKGSDRVREDCAKCQGTGRLNWTTVDGGRCWECQGIGYRTILVSSARARVRRRAARAAEREAEHTATTDKINRARAAAEAIVNREYPEIVRIARAADRPETADRTQFHAIRVIDAVRQGGAEALSAAVAEFRYRIGETATRIQINRYPGPCQTCSTTVPAGTGWVGDTINGWITGCAAHKPESADF